jgi:hypothetical protein
VTTSPTTSVVPAGAPVQLPDLSLSVYRALVADMQADYPENRERIGRGLDVLLSAELRETETAGVYLVQSCKESGLYYRASGLTCTCPDKARHAELQCKHSVAVQLLISAAALAAWERCQAGEPTSPSPPAGPIGCRSCGRESVLDQHGQCDLCGWHDAITIFELTPAGMAYLDRCDAARAAHKAQSA